jgi:hypothetical protein
VRAAQYVRHDRPTSVRPSGSRRRF